jgi:hypothetical protein
MSIDRQFGVHEVPGAERATPAQKPMSGGAELELRGYINAIWAKISEIELKVAALSLRPLMAGVAGARARPVSGPRPWEAEGVSKATWYRRQKGGRA